MSYLNINSENKFINLSHLISDSIPTYGNNHKIEINKNTSILDGDTANTSSWYFPNNHVGTHIDSPYHFCLNGKKTYEIGVEDLIFKNVQLIDVPCMDSKIIDSSDIQSLLSPSDELELLLIRTGYENYRDSDKYWCDNPGIDPKLADYFRKYFPKLRCIGFDFISLTSWKYRHIGRESHREFLCPKEGKPILVIEDMALKDVIYKLEWLIVAPLLVSDGNGGAVSVIAEQLN